MTIRHLIKQLLPLSLAQKYQKRKSFATQFKLSGYDEACDFPEAESQYECIVSVQGFGYSGSGAVIDFLREYPKFSVLGFVDKDEDGGGFTPKTMTLSEIDFIRLTGGLFEIEKFLDSKNVFFNDAILNRTARLFGSSPLYKYNPRIKDLMFRFFAKIQDFRLENLSQAYYNTYTVGLNETPDIYFLRRMPRIEYVSLCRRFLTYIFNDFYRSGKTYLAADQLLADMEFDMERNSEYIPNLKMILVVRDPRDTYAWAIKRNIEWMEHRDVNHFIKWYLQFYSGVQSVVNTQGCLIIKYEDLVLEYDIQEKRINEFLGLDKNDHVHRQEYFKPSFSKRFVGIYKNMPDKEAEFSVIRDKLSNYCNPIID